MTFYDTFIVLGLFLIFIGFALLVYLQFFQLIAQFHFKLMPRLAEKYAKLKQLRLENE
ncbi:MAG: hypothetical protein JZU65_10770 [Chlorobium sp.]|nr:hypothetical protein [Chlorobium sp.]